MFLIMACCVFSLTSEAFRMHAVSAPIVTKDAFSTARQSARRLLTKDAFSTARQSARRLLTKDAFSTARQSARLVTKDAFSTARQSARRLTKDAFSAGAQRVEEIKLRMQHMREERRDRAEEMRRKEIVFEEE